MFISWQGKKRPVRISSGALKYLTKELMDLDMEDSKAVRAGEYNGNQS